MENFKLSLCEHFDLKGYTNRNLSDFCYIKEVNKQIFILNLY